MPVFRVHTMNGKAPVEVVADAYKDVHDPGTRRELWIDFVRWTDDGHTDLAEQRVLRIRSNLVSRIVLLEDAATSDAPAEP